MITGRMLKGPRSQLEMSPVTKDRNIWALKRKITGMDWSTSHVLNARVPYVTYKQKVTCGGCKETNSLI